MTLHTRIPVLVYHLVTPRPLPRRDLVVTPRRFEGHVRMLARFGYRGVTPSAWVGHIRDGAPLPTRPLIFSFDDGYAELTEHAFPVLERYGFRAVVFLVTGELGGYPHWSTTPELSQFRLMTGDEIRHWAARGIEFGAHTRTHPDLRALSDTDAAREIEGSARDLHDLLGVAPTAFAYPYGRYDERRVKLVSDRFACAFAGHAGFADIAGGQWTLGRIEMMADDLSLDVTGSLLLGRPRPIRVQRWGARLRRRLARVR